MRHRTVLRVVALVVLPGASLLVAGVAEAAAGGSVSGVSGGGGVAATQVSIATAGPQATVPLCGIKWHAQYTLYSGPKGPILWGFRTSDDCTNETATALSTQASLYFGSTLERTAPTATCSNCTNDVSHAGHEFHMTGAGSWFVKSSDTITVANIGTDTANGTIIWNFSGGSGSCSEVNANEVQCSTTSNAIVVP
jgi:hypothetical protein